MTIYERLQKYQMPRTNLDNFLIGDFICLAPKPAGSTIISGSITSIKVGPNPGVGGYVQAQLNYQKLSGEIKTANLPAGWRGRWNISLLARNHLLTPEDAVFFRNLSLGLADPE